MGCILLGIVAAILFIVCVAIITVKFSDTFNPAFLCTPFACLLVLGGFISGHLAISGYNEPILTSTIKLLELPSDLLPEDANTPAYLLIENKKYTYNAKVESIQGIPSLKQPKTKRLISNNVLIYEDDTYTDEKLEIYEATPKQTFWTFATMALARTEYVFYVPTGTVVEIVS